MRLRLGGLLRDNDTDEEIQNGIKTEKVPHVAFDLGERWTIEVMSIIQA